MAEAGDGSGHTPLTPEWTPAPRASHYLWHIKRGLINIYTVNGAVIGGLHARYLC